MGKENAEIRAKAKPTPSHPEKRSENVNHILPNPKDISIDLGSLVDVGFLQSHAPAALRPLENSVTQERAVNQTNISNFSHGLDTQWLKDAITNDRQHGK
jgi:hypothetical protein